MPETRFIQFPALSVDPRVEISHSTSETNVRLFFLPMTLTFLFLTVSVFLGGAKVTSLLNV